jgi:phosphoglycolate phosphatase
LRRAVRGVVFDLDGTLVDSYAPITESLNHARAAFGLAALALPEVRQRVGHGLESLIAELVGPERVRRGIALFRERYAATFAAGTTLLPGVEPALRALAARGIRLSVASNKPARFSTAILESLGVRSLLEPVAGPDVVGAAKPDPRMIRYCLARTGLAPPEALYVGDMLLDIESARRADVAVALVEGGSSTPDELRASAAPVMRSIAELPDLIEAWPPA